MNQAVVALIGAAIGALTVLAGSVITNTVSLRNERSRRKEARLVASTQAIREHAAVAFAEIFVVQHAINWITWLAKHDPAAVDNTAIKAYDDEVHKSLPKVLGAMTIVASLDLSVYDKLLPVYEYIYRLDDRVAIALRGLTANREQAVRELQDCLTEITQIERRLPRQVADIMTMEARLRPCK
ncbi:hypothetical protein [Kutzneria sp. CA-103260]|uniref:hypothetical protein n=1 Tax=Kutzneria sp. CA-103260 TaxID=2802641 RepID=UPI001BA7B41E|nr:hypothetical protein [Kutzneria sp. CA-103260]